MILGLVQTSCSKNPRLNLQKTLTAVERAAKSGAQIISTQELFRSQYFCQAEDHENFKLAETNKLPGGGMTRELTATVGGVDRSYHAVEIGGQVSIVQQGLGVSPERGHELLHRTDANAGHGHQAGGWPNRTTAAERAAKQASQVRARRR